MLWKDFRRIFTYLAANVTGPGGRRLTLQGFLQLAGMLDGMGGPVTHFSVAVFQSMAVLTLDRKRVGRIMRTFRWRGTDPAGQSFPSTGSERGPVR